MLEICCDGQGFKARAAYEEKNGLERAGYFPKFLAIITRSLQSTLPSPKDGTKREKLGVVEGYGG
jgi:hypothetical protein